MAAKVDQNAIKNDLGCGFMGRIFQFWNYKQRKSSIHSLPTNTNNNERLTVHDSKRPQVIPSEIFMPMDQDSHKLNSDQNPQRKSPSGLPRNSISNSKSQARRPSDAARSSKSSASNSSHKKVSQQRELSVTENSLELARMSTDQRQFNENKALARETSGNIMLLGNIRCPRNMVENTTLSGTLTKSLKIHPRNIQESNSVPNFAKFGSNSVMGNIIRMTNDELGQFRSPRNRVDPELLKNLGNEAYRQGRYQHALALYDRAIAVHSNNATYHCNKSAALIGLGRLIEAVLECEEALRLDPSYDRAHQRLATLYLRLGEADKTLRHCTQIDDSKIIHQAQSLQNHLYNISEARTSKEWNNILKETQAAISLGADSSPKIFAIQSEALLNLSRHEEAYDTYQKIPNFTVDPCANFFSLEDSAYLWMIGAQVYLSAGRFEDAVAAAHEAAKLDQTNKEVHAVSKRARAASASRKSGNLLFKESKFKEACAIYNEGLDYDPYNSVLLCNRAACRSKLGQFEKAVEDCTAALIVNLTYSKARLRRADCNAKLGRWEAAIQDYETLLREKPGDEEVARALFEAQIQVKKSRGEDIKDLKFGSNLVFISSNDRFRHYVTSPGMSVVLFCNKGTHKQLQVLIVLEQTCKRFPSVHFLKVEIEDHPYIAKSEDVLSTPAFKIYKNGSRVKEIPGSNCELLERTIKLYSNGPYVQK